MGRKELKDIPLTGAYKNTEDIENGASLINGVTNEVGSITRRPGLKPIISLGVNPIDEFYFWKIKKKLFAFHGGNTSKIDENITEADITGDKLSGGLKPSITSNRNYVFAAAGGKPIFSNGDNNTAFHSDSDVASKVSQLENYYNYLLMNDLDNPTELKFSVVDEPLNINAGDHKAIYDGYIKGIKKIGDDLLIQNDDYSERWQAAIDYSGVKTFDKLRGVILQRGGTIAPQSFVKADTYYWLNQYREIVGLIEGDTKTISIPINKILKTYSRVDDCFAIHMPLESMFMILWVFPSVGKTWCYNYLKKDWSEWTSWNLSRSRHENWIGNAGVDIPAWNKYLVGSRTNGKIYETSFNYSDDDGQEIKTEVVTPFINHGYPGKMVDEPLILNFKRGFNTSRESKLMFQFRNSGKSEWSNERTYSFGKIGQTEYQIPISGTGEHKGRQYKFSWTDPVSTIFVKAQSLVEFKGI